MDGMLPCGYTEEKVMAKPPQRPDRNGDDDKREDYPEPPPQRRIPWPNNPPVRNPHPTKD